MTHLEDRITRRCDPRRGTAAPVARPVRPGRREHRGRPAPRRRHGLIVLVGARSSPLAASRCRPDPDPPPERSPRHALVDPRSRHDPRPRRHRAVARALHQAVRAGLRRRRLPRQPVTGKSYIVLTDIVYYLIFAAYILFTRALRAAGRLEQRRSRASSPPSSSSRGLRGSAASCSSSASCTGSTSCSCRCSAGCSRSTGGSTATDGRDGLLSRCGRWPAPSRRSPSWSRRG